LKDLKTVLETLNSDSVCLPDSIVKTILFESGLMNLVSAQGNMEKYELSHRVKHLGKKLADTTKDNGIMDDMFTMEEYRDILLVEAELIQFVMEYRKKLGDKPKILGKVDLNNIS